MSTLFLTEIRRLPDQRAFRLQWSDGHSAELPYGLVRGYCPCAGCQGHGDGKVTFKVVLGTVATTLRPTTIEPVGNYGISIAWSDGHATGIYRFDYLRAMCPCPACNDLEADATPPTIDTARL
jgi:DUF971 family protein